MILFYIQVTTKYRIDVYPAFLLYILLLRFILQSGLYYKKLFRVSKSVVSNQERVMMAHVGYIYLLQAIQIIQLGMENPVRRPSRFPGFIRVCWVKVFSVCAVAECYQRSKKWKPSASFRSNSMKETGDQRGGTSEVSQCAMSYCF